MKIFKFGGASVKDSNGIKNVAKVLQHEGIANTLVVVSAMGKTTNNLENLIDAYYHKKEYLLQTLHCIKDFHQNIIDDLFEKDNPIYNEIEILFNKLTEFIDCNRSPNYHYIYDQIVCFGELFSTKIISAYLASIKIENTWVDVRNLIKTDSNYRDAKVNWELTKKNIKHKINSSKLIVTQGFLSGNNTGDTTTLGREGSDYTAGIFAYSLQAKSVTIWKDVQGVFNADPKIFNNPQLLNQISYKEAIEMAFYGASVIHPKTIQPLKNKKIPLYVRSFNDFLKKGTKVTKGIDLEPHIPCYIVKNNQILVSISAKDFSFMVENNISYIFKKLHEYKIKVNLIQNSAISFSVCVEDKFDNFSLFYKELKSSFKIQYNKNVRLHTIRHFNEKSIDNINEKGTPLLKQINKKTMQVVMK